MALTRIRAQQISNIDYKQAVRVVTTSNINLAGGAPSSVDGVALSINSRILVNGQGIQTQNGLYLVQTVGTGSNGTWVRTNDTDTTGEMQAGMVVTVTEGNTYRDTLWTLTTDDPVVLGSSNITFQQSTSFSFGNISANGTAILANTVGDGVTFTAGDNITIVGNATAKTVTIGVTGIETSEISNGTSTVAIATANGNVTVSVDGTSNVAVFTATGANITGTIEASGNIAGAYFIGNGSQLTGLPEQYGNANVAAYLPTYTGNIGAGNITATGNVSANYFLGNGSQLSGIITSVANINNGTSNVSIDAANANITMAVDGTANIVVVSTGLVDVTGNLTTSGNIVGGGIRSTTSSTPPSSPAVGDVWFNTNNSILYRYTYDGVSDFWEDITGGSLVANSTAIIHGTSSVVVTEADGNVAVNINGVANTAVFAADRITVAGNLLPNANITYNLGSSSQRWKDLWIANSTIYIGDAVIAATGNVITVGGQTVITSTNSDTLSLTGNITAGNVDTAGNVNGGNIITAGNISGAYIIGNGSQLTGLPASYGNADVAAYLPSYSGNLGGVLTTAAQPNITSLGTLSTLTVTGPSNHTGNIDVTGNINVTGNLNYDNVTDLVVGDPLIYIGANNTGNLFDLGMIVAWDDGVYQHGGWVRDASDGTWKLFGNVVEEPTTTVDFTNAIYQPMLAGAVTATGNISGNYILGNGSQLTGISTSTTKIFNGTSQINIGVANGAANVSIGAASNVAVFSETGVAVDGAVSAESVTATNGLLLNSNTVTANYTVASGFNAVSVGPMTVANNISVTVTAGQRWIVL